MFFGRAVCLLWKDVWPFKGQKGIILEIRPNLYPTETPLNKTAYSDVATHAPIIHAAKGLGALNLLRSDRLDYLESPQRSTNIYKYYTPFIHRMIVWSRGFWSISCWTRATLMIISEERSVVINSLTSWFKQVQLTFRSDY